VYAESLETKVPSRYVPSGGTQDARRKAGRRKDGSPRVRIGGHDTGRARRDRYTIDARGEVRKR